MEYFRNEDSNIDFMVRNKHLCCVKAYVSSSHRCSVGRKKKESWCLGMPGVCLHFPGAVGGWLEKRKCHWCFNITSRQKLPPQRSRNPQNSVAESLTWYLWYFLHLHAFLCQQMERKKLKESGTHWLFFHTIKVLLFLKKPVLLQRRR